MTETEGCSETRLLVLASGSRYRASVLADAGIAIIVDSPDLDERLLDEQFRDSPPEKHALELAELKAHAVAPRHSGALVLAADQLGVLDSPEGHVVLHKRPGVDEAVDQLMSMSGTTHRLVNGIVILDTASGRTERGVDVMRVTMRDFNERDARDYVVRFEPFDCAGSYRIEDQNAMGPIVPFITGIDGEDASGILGMPLPLLRRMLAAVSR